MRLIAVEEVVEVEFLLLGGIGGGDWLEADCGGITLEGDDSLDRIGAALGGNILRTIYLELAKFLTQRVSCVFEEAVELGW